MKFDRTVPGGSVEAACGLVNGKAVVEWAFHLIQDKGKQAQKVAVPPGSEEERRLLQKEKGYIRLILSDRQGNIVLECVQKLCEEEPLQSILLQPELWKGVRNPYLFGTEAILADEAGTVRDRIQGKLALRCLSAACRDGEPGLVLNNEPFVPKAVRYALPGTGTEAAIQRQMLEDMQWMLKLGANCVCVEGGWEDGGGNGVPAASAGDMEIHAIPPEACRGAGKSRGQALQKLLLQECERHGFLIFQREESQPGYVWAHGRKTRLPVSPGEDIPLFRGKSPSLFLPGSRHPDSLYYQYQVKWGEAPFVHIVPESIRRLESGNFAVLCYSNCSRVALYSDGILFEFKSGDGAFWFREIPARSPSIMLAAEGEGCRESLSIHKSFTK